MPSPFDPLVDIIHSTKQNEWKDRNEKALAALFGTRYPMRAEKSVTLRAPEMREETMRMCPMPLTSIRRTRLRVRTVA